MGKIVTMGKARQLYEILKEKIEEGGYEQNARLPSIRVLAEKYQLSNNTVNTALAMLVSEGLVTIRDGLGAFVTHAARKSRMIGVMLFDFGVGIRVDNMILEQIQKNLPSEYYLSLVNTSDRYDVFCDGLEHLIDVGAAGLIIIPPKDDPKYITDFNRVKDLLSRVPTVFINRGIPGIEADSYSMDLFKGLSSVFGYLAATGKRRTALVMHDSVKFAQEEEQAVNAYRAHYGLPEESVVCIPWDDDIREIQFNLKNVLPETDSIIAPDNVMIQLTDMIAGTGKSIPEELSLIGINDTLLSRLYNPPLTSVVFPVERIARHVVHKLVARIENTEQDAPVFRNFTPEFVIRKT